jgi:outer membrane receptor for ferrienterochelin and colicins
MKRMFMKINFTLHQISDRIKRYNRLFIIGSLTLFSFLLSIKASAQDAGKHMISGKVSDIQTKETLVGAAVSTIPAEASAFSAADGTFSLEFETALQLVITYVGYENDTISLSDGSEELSIELKPLKTLKEVTITSRRKSTEIGLLEPAKMEKIGSRELMKAACCNLSESFETTPSVDVGFTDAVSGYKQIQMLGLAGSYTSFTRENIPDVRGLAAITGLTFTPGAFVESMQLSKGTGSVVNGYEGTAGQINIEWRKPFEEKEPALFLNGYQSVQGRSEMNAILSHKFNDELSSNLLLHAKSNWMKVDQNHDGFLDNPLGNTFVGSNRWFWFSPKGLEVQGGIKAVYLNNTGGQKSFEKGTEQIAGNPWGYQQSLTRMEAWAKIGKVNLAKPYQSMGLQLSGVYHDQQSQYGVREYDGRQQSFYANYIYQSIINNTNHVIKAGASFSADAYKETLVGTAYNRTEIVPGGFMEYAYNYKKKFNMVAGLRADYHNLFGAFVTPRLHLRYALSDNSALRASAGRAQRTANIFAENTGYLASSRNFIITGSDPEMPYGLKPEVAWNMGLNYTKKFMLNYRDGAFSMDYYYTDFTNQVVVDVEKPGEVSFYNLNGKSYAHSFQAQLDYEVIHKLDVRLAYRFYDVRTTYDNTLKEKPLVAAHRAFMNVGYETKSDWKFDYTFQWTGSKRLPERYSHHDMIIAEGNSPSFIQMNAQISKSWKEGKIEVYAGGENLTGYMQHDMISGAENPFGKSFDGSLIWGPGMGRNFYVGFRYGL